MPGPGKEASRRSVFSTGGGERAFARAFAVPLFAGFGQAAAGVLQDMSGSSRIRYGVAAFGGLLWAAAFPKAGVAGLAWVAPAIVLFSAAGRSGRAAFGLGYVAGLAHYLSSLYWLLFIPFPVGAVAGWLSLSAYLAVYPALWVWLCWRIHPGRAPSDKGSWIGFAADFALTPLFARAAWALGCAVVWVALELAVSRFLSGFPWNLLGASQYRMVPLIQIAAWTGVYGVSFVVVWFAVSFGCAMVSLLQRPAARSVWLSEVLLPALVVTALYGYGLHRVESTSPEAPVRILRVALVQPSIKQELIFDPQEDPARFQKLMDLSRAALAKKPQVLIWPEAAMPSFDERNFLDIQALIRSNKVWMIFGADDVEPAKDGSERFNFYNSAFLLDPEARYVASYRKRRLVIFGEYVPLATWLPFLRHLTPIEGGFTAGERPAPFELPGLDARISTLICFEDNFPQLVRQDATPDINVLLNLTNNGWFGESAAQWQHAANAVFRAVENGLPLVRCTNNGLTCWVDSWGRLHDVYFPGSDDIYQAGFKIAEVPLARESGRTATLYHRAGDWFAWGCLGLTALLATVTFLRRG